MSVHGCSLGWLTGQVLASEERCAMGSELKVLERAAFVSGPKRWVGGKRISDGFSISNFEFSKSIEFKFK